MDKSRSTQRTDKENTFNKVNKSGYNSRTSLSNKITKIEKLSEIDISNDDLSISVLSGYWEILSSITPYQQRIPCNNKINKPHTPWPQGKKLFNNQSTEVKVQKRILYLM